MNEKKKALTKATAKIKDKLIAFMVGLIFLTLLAYVIHIGSFKRQARSKQASSSSNPKIEVVASFYPLADFAKNIGGDLVSVVNITPSGAEPHDYEPTPQDIAKVYNAKLFIFNGNGEDAWADKIGTDLPRGVPSIRMADHFYSLKSDVRDSEKLSFDPHFWLDPINVEKQADLIADALIKIDGIHEKEYRQNREVFKAKLVKLDQEYRTGLEHCQLHVIVTSHNAFNYMANRYHLTTLYLSGLSPDEEPSPKTIAEVADIARRRHISYIFFESLVSPKLSQTLANEIGAQTLKLNPIEGLTEQEIAQGKDYISEMKNNLTNLRIALSCQ